MAQHSTMSTPTIIMRLPAVRAARGGIGRSTHYLHVERGLWTKPIRTGIRSIGWPLSEVEALNAARIAGKSDDEIRALVTRLEAARKEAK